MREFVFETYADCKDPNQQAKQHDLIMAFLMHLVFNGLFKYIENFIIKNRKFSHKKVLYFLYFYIFHTSVQSIDSGYSLEPPR